jgi:hypothetical protein
MTAKPSPTTAVTSKITPEIHVLTRIFNIDGFYLDMTGNNSTIRTVWWWWRRLISPDAAPHHRNSK